MADQKIQIFALAAHGKGISGSDRIFIEFSKHWIKKHPVLIYLWEEGYRMCQRQKLGKLEIKFKVLDMKPWKNFGFVINYLARIIKGVKIASTLKIDESQNTIIYAASEFWMDSLPTFILKLRYPKIKWVAAWYQTAPKPWKGFTNGYREEKYYFKALIYWLNQQPIRLLISNFADFVLVNNENEKKQFTKLNKYNRAIVVLGAINIKEIQIWKKKFKNLPKIYDAVFQGRFHPQKGVLELIDIWKRVTQKRSEAKLIMIGDGPLMEKVKSKVRSEKLGNNIKLTGYLFDGEEKYRIFAQSKLVVHPSFYDSGGIASLEAISFGLPCVGFNLKSYEHYYPRGIIKVKVGDLDSFAEKILLLLSNKSIYSKKRKKVLKIINDKLSWEYRSRQILNQVLE